MEKATDAKEKLAEQMKTVAYVTRYYPEAKVDMETNQFVDASISIEDADGFTFKINGQVFSSGAVGTVTPFKKMKRRAKESEPIKIHGAQAFNLTAKHLEIMLNSIDTKKAVHILDKALKCQVDKNLVRVVRREPAA